MGKNRDVVFAGVIPYRITEEGFHFLLGEESDGDGWCGFGGGPEVGETAQEAAIREGWEETMGLLGTKSDLKQLIRKSQWVLTGNKDSGKKSVQYLVKASKGIDKSFNEVIKYLTYCNEGCFPKTGCYEKTRVKWFKIGDIIEAAKNKKPLLGKKGFELRKGFLQDMIYGNLKVRET